MGPNNDNEESKELSQKNHSIISIMAPQFENFFKLRHKNAEFLLTIFFSCHAFLCFFFVFIRTFQTTLKSHVLYNPFCVGLRCNLAKMEKQISKAL